MDFDTEVKLAIYRHIAENAHISTIDVIAHALGAHESDIRSAYVRLFEKRVLVLDPDGESIRMAPPFSGIETQHRVRVGEKEYFANCCWDSLGVAAALQSDADVFSRCEQTMEPLHIRVRRGSVEPEECIAHFAVPAARWWEDIAYT